MAGAPAQLSSSLRSRIHLICPTRHIQGEGLISRQLGLTPREARLSAAVLWQQQQQQQGTTAHSAAPPAGGWLAAALPSPGSQLRGYVPPPPAPLLGNVLTPPPVAESRRQAVPLCTLMELLSVGHIQIRLPPSVSQSPITTPGRPAAPQQLPQSDTAVASIVEPLRDVVPRELPQRRAKRRLTIHCSAYAIRQRRRSMKKHKKKKERRRNRVSLEHATLARLMAKEKAFMAEQTALLKEAECFDAKKHVDDILARLTNKPVPKFWKGKRLHEPVVIELMHKAGLKIPGQD